MASTLSAGQEDSCSRSQTCQVRVGQQGQSSSKPQGRQQERQRCQRQVQEGNFQQGSPPLRGRRHAPVKTSLRTGNPRSPMARSIGGASLTSGSLCTRTPTVRQPSARRRNRLHLSKELSRSLALFTPSSKTTKNDGHAHGSLLSFPAMALLQIGCTNSDSGSYNDI